MAERRSANVRPSQGPAGTSYHPGRGSAGGMDEGPRHRLLDMGRGHSITAEPWDAWSSARGKGSPRRMPANVSELGSTRRRAWRKCLGGTSDLAARLALRRQQKGRDIRSASVRSVDAPLAERSAGTAYPGSGRRSNPIVPIQPSMGFVHKALLEILPHHCPLRPARKSAKRRRGTSRPDASRAWPNACEASRHEAASSNAGSDRSASPPSDIRANA